KGSPCPFTITSCVCSSSSVIQHKQAMINTNRITITVSLFLRYEIPLKFHPILIQKVGIVKVLSHHQKKQKKTLLKRGEAIVIFIFRHCIIILFLVHEYYYFFSNSCWRKRPNCRS